METSHRDETPSTWVGRASTRPPADLSPTAEQPVVPLRYAPPPHVVYVEQPRRPRSLLFALGLLVAFVAGGATLALILSPALRGAIGMDQPSSSPTTEPSPTPPPPPPPPGIGDPVQDGTFTFVVNNLACGIPQVGSGIFTERPDGQFCIVDITVTNDGRFPAIFSDDAQYVHTAAGTRENADGTAGLLANGFDLGRYWVNPDSTVTGKVVFDIPVDTSIVTIELHDSLLSEGVTVTVS